MGGRRNSDGQMRGVCEEKVSKDSNQRLSLESLVATRRRCVGYQGQASWKGPGKKMRAFRGFVNGHVLRHYSI